MELKHNHISDGEEWGEEKAKFNLTFKINEPAQSFYSTKEITKSFLAQVATFLSVGARFQDTSRRHFSQKVRISHRSGEGGMGRVCRVPVTRLPGCQTRIEPAETDR